MQEGEAHPCTHVFRLSACDTESSSGSLTIALRKPANRPSCAQDRLADLQKLKRKLEESAMEARAFAEQQKADVLKHQKRTIQEVGSFPKPLRETLRARRMA